MASGRRDGTLSAMAEVGADFALLSSPDAVCYASGMVVPIETGPSPFAGGPPLALVASDGATYLIVSDREEGMARDADPDVEVRVYEGYTWDRPLRPSGNYLEAISGVIGELDVAGRVAAERAALPASVASLVADVGEIVDIGHALAQARAIKTVGEVSRLRRATEMTALAHARIAEAAQPGRTELALFGEARAAWEGAAGSRVPAMGDLLSGIIRTASVLGGPTDRVLEAGDPLIADLVPRIDGYWGDTCSTHVVGSATPAFRHLRAAVAESLSRGIDALRPGITGGQLDALLREPIRRAGYGYPHHSGHGIGTSVHEFPRIVPDEAATIQPGMVICLEPGAYDPEVGGARLEWTFLVEADGSVPLVPMNGLLDACA